MIEYVKLTSIKPATYNPRKIGSAQFIDLQESLRTIGCVLPVIVNRSNNVIIAGHQRCKALAAIGAQMVPAAYVKDITIADEMTFNQMHNGTEQQARGAWTYNGDGPVECFTELDSTDFAIEGVTGVALKEICRLLTRYGNVLSCVACCGRVYIGGAYVKACQLLRLPVNAYICEKGKRHLLDNYFSKAYGEYSYDGLTRKTYLQGLAQMHRNVTKTPKNKKANASKTYCEGVIPYLQDKPLSTSILDFGCGKGAYIQHLKSLGYNAVGVEFYNNNGTSIDVAKGNAQIDALVRHLKTCGRFDVVVCDSVLNSVDSMAAEDAVLCCLSAFCKPGGKLFISGRPIEDAQFHAQSRISSDRVTYITFLDADGFTAKFRRGNWYFQHYHSRESFARSLDRAQLRIEKYQNNKTSFWSQCAKIEELPEHRVCEAVTFEFNLPLPGGKRYNRHNEVINALKEAV